METKQSNNSATPMADAVKIANQRALFSLEWENDTVFKKRELNYKTKAAFQKDLEAGKISKYTTVFIKDSKEIYKNGQYYGAGSSSEETSDVIINISSLESNTGQLSGITYNEIVDCIKKNKNIKVRMNMGGMGYTFTPISCVYIERSNLVTISIDTSLMQYANAYTKIVTLTIVNDNSYAISSVDKSVICENFVNNGDILINLSYKGLSGQEEKSTSVTLKKTGNGTKVLTDNGSYREFISEAPTDGGVYGRKNKQWEKIESIKQKIVTESEYSALGDAVNTDGILYFVTPD